MKRELTAIKVDIGSLQDDMSTIKSKMLTKDHFDIIISHLKRLEGRA